MSRMFTSLILICFFAAFPAATALADSAYSAEAGVFKFRETPGQSYWRVQDIKFSGVQLTQAGATWNLVGSPWGNTASGEAMAIAMYGAVQANANASTNALSGGSVGAATATVDDLMITRRDGSIADDTVVGTVRLTIAFNSAIAVSNLHEGNRPFNASRLDWEFTVLDVFATPFSGWITHTPDGTFSSGSQTLGSQTVDVPFGVTAGTLVGLRLGANLGAQVLGNSDQTANVSVTSDASILLGEVVAERPDAPRLAIIVPPEYRADSVKWNIVDGYLMPPSTVPCPADLDGSGVVDPADIGLLLLDFGACSGCPSDFDGSGETDSSDLGLMLLEFGDCPSQAR